MAKNKWVRWGYSTLLIGFITVKGAHLVVDDCFFLGKGTTELYIMRNPMNQPVQ